MRIVDLERRGRPAGGETLDLLQREDAVGGRALILQPELLLEMAEDLFAASEVAGDVRADLHMKSADRREVVHGVEGRDLLHLDWGHAEQVPDEVHDLG